MFGSDGHKNSTGFRKQSRTFYNSGRARLSPAPSTVHEKSAIAPTILLDLKNKDSHKGFIEVQKRLGLILGIFENNNHLPVFVDPAGRLSVTVSTLRNIATSLIENDPSFACDKKVFEDLWLTGFTRPLKVSTKLEDREIAQTKSIHEWRTWFMFDWLGYLTKLHDTLELYQQPDGVASSLSNLLPYLPPGYSLKTHLRSDYQLPITYQLRDIALCISRIQSHLNRHLANFWMRRALGLNTLLKGSLYTEIGREAKPSECSPVENPTLREQLHSMNHGLPTKTGFSLYVQASATPIPLTHVPKERKGILKLALQASHALALSIADSEDKPTFVLHDVTNLPFARDLSDERFVNLHDSVDSIEQLLYKEHPNLYFLVDNPASSSTRSILKYLSDQASLSMGISVQTFNLQIHRFHPRCLSLATEHFIFLFDWRILGENFLRTALGDIFENESVQKIVREFEFSELRQYLSEKHSIRFKNLYDVAQNEKRLDAVFGSSPSIPVYSLRRLQRKYQDKSCCFEAYPNEVVENTSWWKKDYSLRESAPQLIRELVCEVAFLKRLAELQAEKLLSPALAKIEAALVEIYLCDDPKEFLTNHRWGESSENLDKVTKSTNTDSDSEDDKELMITKDSSYFLVN